MPQVVIDARIPVAGGAPASQENRERDLTRVGFLSPHGSGLECPSHGASCSPLQALAGPTGRSPVDPGDARHEARSGCPPSRRHVP